MAKWAVVVAEDRYSQERLYAARFAPGGELPAGDEALLVAALDPPVVFGVARADAEGRLRYTVNLIDAPLPFGATLAPGSHPIDEAAFTAVTAAATPTAAGPSGEAPADGTAGGPATGPAGATAADGTPGASSAPGVTGAMGVADAGDVAGATDAPGATGATGVAGPNGVGAAVTGVAGKRTWLVSVDLPIEAETPAAAVREFWTYVRDLGPAELPAFVWPVGNELAMQAFVLGVEANQDPEED